MGRKASGCSHKRSKPTGQHLKSGPRPRGQIRRPPHPFRPSRRRTHPRIHKEVDPLPRQCPCRAEPHPRCTVPGGHRRPHPHHHLRHPFRRPPGPASPHVHEFHRRLRGTEAASPFIAVCAHIEDTRSSSSIRGRLAVKNASSFKTKMLRARPTGDFRPHVNRPKFARDPPYKSEEQGGIPPSRLAHPSAAPPFYRRPEPDRERLTRAAKIFLQCSTGSIFLRKN
jgi:hypothetical protein